MNESICRAWGNIVEDENNEKGQRVALDSSDISQLSMYLYRSRPHLLASFPSFLEKIQEAPNLIVTSPTNCTEEFLRLFNEPEKEIFYIYLILIYKKIGRGQTSASRNMKTQANIIKRDIPRRGARKSEFLLHAFFELLDKLPANDVINFMLLLKIIDFILKLLQQKSP